MISFKMNFVRNGLVAIRLIEQPDEQRTKEGIWLPIGGLGMQFALAEIVHVGRGVLLDQGGHGGTDDLKVGDRVLVKTGQKQSRGNGDVQGVEMRSCLDIDLGGDNIIVLNQLDILAVLKGEEVPDSETEPAKVTRPQLVV